jgi:hypothetical protein
MNTCGFSVAPSWRWVLGLATLAERNGQRPFRQLRHMLPTHSARWGIAGLFVLFVLLTIAGAAVRAETEFRAENASVKIRRNSERTAFSDAEIADGLFKIAFGSELSVAGGANRVRKFDGPVRVFLDNRAHSNRHADIATVIGDIGTYVDHLDIRLTQDRKAANVVITLVRNRAELLRTMRSFYGRKRADEIERRLQPRCLSGFGEDPEHRIRRAEVLLTDDGGDFSFLDCAYEELLQALGPINDDRSVPWSMFNDDVQMGFFDVYDQYILNILYDPHVRPGMTRGELELILPDILPQIREWVSGANSTRRLRASNGAGSAFSGPIPGQFPVTRENPKQSD